MSKERNTKKNNWGKQSLRSGILRALKECSGRLFRISTQHKHNSSDVQEYVGKSRKGNPQKLTQLSSRSHPRHLVGKRTAQKDATKDTISDNQVNSYFPYRWSPASLTINIFFLLIFIFIYNNFLYLYITRITINNILDEILKLLI